MNEGTLGSGRVRRLTDPTTTRQGTPHVSDANAFDWLCAELESHSTLARLEARGTVRIALKQSGLDARSVDGEQLRVVIERVLPDELRSRGVDDADPVCEGLLQRLERQDFCGDAATQSPDAIFRRLGGH